MDANRSLSIANIGNNTVFIDGDNLFIQALIYNGSVAGIGFLALAALIFGQWKPLGILGSTFFFGFATTIGGTT